MKIHPLFAGTLRMKKGVYFSDAARDESIDIPVSCFLVRHEQGNLLFDTGCHPELTIDASARIGGMARAMQVVSTPGVTVLDSLAQAGCRPDDIDLVVNSHLHTDHCGCNTFFGRAAMICHRCELAAARAENASRSGYFGIDWESCQSITEIEADHDVFGDGSVVLIPLPGHTPGSIGALLTPMHGAPVLLTADAASMQSNLDKREVPRNTWNADLFVQSLDEIDRLRSAGTRIFYGHDPQQWPTLAQQRVFG